MNELFENWSEIKTSLMDGLPANQRKVVGQLMENQKSYIAESATPGSTDTTAIAGFRKILIPLIRRVIPGTIATEVVGVQAMNGPVGLVYTQRYKYNDAVPGGSGALDTPAVQSIRRLILKLSVT